MTATPLDRSEPLTRSDLAIEDTWNLEPYFSSGEAWEEAAARVETELAAAVAHRGRLGESARSLRSALDDIMRMRLTLEHVHVYASLRHHEDMADSARLARYERAVSLAIRAAEDLSFFDPELLAIPADRFDRLAADPELAPYRHLLDDLGRFRPHVRSAEVEEVLAQASDIGRGPSQVFSALDNADLTYGEVADETGKVVTLTKGRHQLLLRSQDRSVREAASRAFMAPYLAHSHTLAALYSASVRGGVFDARVRRFPSARAEALFSDNLPDAVYENLVAGGRAAAPVSARYLDLRRRILGVDQLQMYDLYAPLSPEPEERYAYREAVDVVLDGLGALGGRYVDDLRRGFAGRWVDVYETKGKRSGAYSSGAYGGPPVMLMNWNGSISDVFTLAHEAGLSLHTFYSDAANPFHLAGYPIFLAEIASTVNETLLNWSLIERTPRSDAAARFALLNRFADTWFATVVRQTMFAEFEDRAHALVEAREPLTLDLLNDLFGELYAVHHPGVAVDDAVRITWGRIPHFYRAFYVYQYATGLSAAIALAAAMRDEGPPAQERYLHLISAGGRDYPLELLRAAGVDLASPEPVRASVAGFDRVVRELEAIEASGALRP
ncbi:MAG: oligoendopeptidase F [Chloroflexota bacterium]